MSEQYCSVIAPSKCQLQAIFTQGDKADAIFYIQKGKVKLTVLSKTGREATIAILGEGKFFGEGALAGQGWRMGAAGAMNYCEVFEGAKDPVVQARHRGKRFFGMFVWDFLGRKIPC